ncbi:hypothetical protein ACOMHN_025646 [Nucella lapillus]
MTSLFHHPAPTHRHDVDIELNQYIANGSGYGGSGGSNYARMDMLMAQRRVPHTQSESGSDSGSGSGSTNYAEMDIGVTQRRVPHTHHFHRPVWQRISRSLFGDSFRYNPSSRYYNSPRAFVCKTHCQHLKHVRQKLYRRNKRLAKVLAFMFLLLVATVTPLLAYYSRFLGQVLHKFSKLWTPSSARSSSLECWGLMSENFTDFQHFRCDGNLSLRGEESCESNVGTTLCSIMKIKAGLDHRTKTLHGSVDKLSDSTHQLLHSLVNKSSENHISALYNYRPSIHLLFYYSAEVKTESDQGLHKLQWKGSPGLQSAHDIQPLTKDPSQPEVFQGFRVKELGYYYLYSHVTFQASCAANYYTDVRVNNRVILKSTPGTNTSYLNAVVLLENGDTVSVHSICIDKVYTENTYLGTYQV